MKKSRASAISKFADNAAAPGNSADRRFADRSNQLYSVDRPVHGWYRFVLSFPPHLVREYLQRFGMTGDQRLLDPFCGTGTTIVECKKLGIPSVGIEANPMAYFASQTKVDWSPDPDGLLQHAEQVASEALAALQSTGIADDVFALSTNGQLPAQLKTLPSERMELLLTDSPSVHCRCTRRWCSWSV
jgi:hypothetical protein